MTPLLAEYVPFLDPIHGLQGVWYLLLLPLAFGISLIYRAVRVRTFERFWQGVGVMTLQIVLAMVALAVALILLVQVAIPLLPVDR